MLYNIQVELKRNLEVLEDWIPKHKKMGQAFTHLISGKNDSLKIQLKKYEYFNISVITENESLINNILAKTAWESAKSTEIIEEFDFNTVMTLNEVYELQNVIMEKTINDLSRVFFERSTHNIEDLDATILQFQLRFMELTGQEELLRMSYKQVLEEI